MGKNNAFLPNINSLIQAGINPKTGLPIKAEDANKCMLKENIKRQLRKKDRIEFLGRYKWFNLPGELDSELLERILFYRGQGAFFFMKEDKKFYFLPYALAGNIDMYGKYRSITPVPFNGPAQEGKDKPWITGLIKKCYYDFPEEEELLEAFEEGCVLLYDYPKGMSETIIPQSVLQETILDMEAEAFPMARTSLLANSGISAMRVNSDDEASEVKRASLSITNAALTGDPFIPITSQIEFQELTSSGSALKAEEYMMYMQSLENYRKAQMGLGNGALFEKSSHMLQTEADLNTNDARLVYDAGLKIRQRFCDIANAIWGLGIWCEANETVVMQDENMDGMLNDDVDQSGKVEGEQPEGVTTDGE